MTAMMPAMTPLAPALLAGFLACAALAGSAAAQAPNPTNGLTRARAVFTAADRDANGRLTLDELRANQMAVTEREFTGEDFDRDGAWSRDEFTVHFRTLLARSGERPSADLDAEVVRVLGLRRARTVDEARGRPGPGAGRTTNSAVPTGSPPQPAKGPQPPDSTAGAADLDARIEAALTDLETKALARQATRAEFARVRGLWNERTAGASRDVPPGSPQDAVAARFARALDALEARARAGVVTRTEFADLRSAWAARARRAVTSGKPADPAPDSIEARFERALAELEAKAFARSATRADWQRVKDLLVERARRAVQGGTATPPPADDPRVTSLATELRAALDALEQAAAEGRLTRAAFQELRTRTAASSSTRPTRND